MNTKKIIDRFKTISLFGMSQLLSAFSVLILSYIIIQFHSVELWGEYVEVLIWTNVFLLFLSFGNNDYLLKLFSENPSNINQQWTNNLFARSILLLPSLLLILFIPIFNHLELIIFIVILFQFINQSFKSLIVYHRKFTLNIYVESSYLLALILLVFYNLESLNLKLLLEIILLSQGLKLLLFSIVLLKDFKHIKFQFQLLELKKSIPFFIPLALGTFRSKIDAYYGTHFFSVSQLSKYQVFLSFLALSQMASTFVITPYLKNYYRSSNTVIKNTQKKFFVFGWGFAVVATVFMYVAISEIYRLDFTFQQYGLAFLFMIPLFLHVLLVSEYYKRDQQYKIAFFASIVVFFQIIIGYFLIKYWNINGALLLKLLGQWGIVITLWFWIKKQK
tara:strand:+ start:46931 stop:48100 length:1170 start_codon:yes stop_codon:yes gene_type:complete